MDDLETLRKKIDETDQTILTILAKRFSLVKKIGKYKKQLNMPIINKNREEEKINILIQKGQKKGVPKNFITKIWNDIFVESYKLET